MWQEAQEKAFSVQHLVPGRTGTGQAQSSMPPKKADISPEPARLALAHCLSPQALRSSKGPQQEPS